MTSFQKVIKYIAMALAIFLTVTIIGGIITGISSISFLLSGKETETVGEMQYFPIDGEISSLSVTLSGAELKIKTADKFSVESNHKYISVKENNFDSLKGFSDYFNIPYETAYEKPVEVISSVAKEKNISVLVKNLGEYSVIISGNTAYIVRG